MDRPNRKSPVRWVDIAIFVSPNIGGFSNAHISVTNIDNNFWTIHDCIAFDLHFTEMCRLGILYRPHFLQFCCFFHPLERLFLYILCNGR